MNDGSSKHKAFEELKARWLARLAAALEDGSFVKATVGHPSNSSGPSHLLKKLILRPVLIRGEKRCSVVSRFATRDETKNLSFPDAIALVEARLGTEFLSGVFFSENEEVSLDLARKPRLRTVATARPAAALGHDRLKKRKVDARAPYLQALGVTDAAGRVRERMGDKFRQIERFVDLLDTAFRESSLAERNAAPITLCDMGAGKGYLTFAAFEHLGRVARKPVSAVGVELREELVALCNRVAKECGCDGLRFERGDIATYPLAAVDILVALHACDTATDEALAAGVRAGAEIILAAPCCHKEARPQVDAAAPGEGDDSGPLRDVLRHGIFAERHAEMATDALRALLLEAAGYRVRIGEFVAAEHTAKNVMLIATRRPGSLSKAAAETLPERIATLKAFYGIRHHRLEQLLLERR